MKKGITLLLVLVMLFSLVAFSASATEEEVTLTMMHFFTPEDAKNNVDSNAFRVMLEQYQADHPELTLNINEMAHDDYQVKIQANAAANDMPDIFMMKGSWVENWVENGLAYDLTADIEALPFYEDYYPGEFTSATYNGSIYGMPVQFVSPTALVFYNEAMWKEAGFDSFPATFEEIEAAVPHFKEAGITPISLGNKDKWPYESCWISCIGDRFTGSDWMTSIMARDGEAKFTDENFVKMLQFSADLGQSGILNEDFNSITNQQADDLYCQGKAAATIEGYWTVTYILGNADEEVLANTKIALIPQPAGAEMGAPNSASASSGWFVTINGNLEGAKLEAAKDLVFTFLGQEYSEKIANDGSIGPIRIEGVDRSGSPQLRQDYAAIVETFTPVAVYDVVLNGSIVDVMNAGLQEVLAGTKTPQVLAEEIQAEQDAL